jgi:hypothetical protein
MKSPETVVLYAHDYFYSGKNEVKTRLTELTRRLAYFKGAYSHYNPIATSSPPDGRWYFVPVFTFVKPKGEALEIQGHKIQNEDDLFGGVVPSEHLTAKGFLHPLVTQRAAHPEGWKRRFHKETEGLVLPGYTIFDKDDAPRATKLLTQRGFIPLGKQSNATSGDGQRLVQSETDLQEALSVIPDDEMRRFGYVLEAGLLPDTVNTISVGRVCVNDIEFTYYGKQKTTDDVQGIKRYGGTEMYLVRGDFSALIARVRSQDIPIIKGLEKNNILFAIEQAKAFDEYAVKTLKIFGSRRNYDVVQGKTADGTFHSGVTDQSWRIGGASGPEILGLQMFREDIKLQTLLGSSFNFYSDTIYTNKSLGLTLQDPRISQNAVVFFKGSDNRYEGRLTSGATIGEIPFDSYKR